MFPEKIKAKHGKHRVVVDARWGYARLDPLPSENEIGEFYKKKYYALIKKGGRAPELRRQMGPEKERDLEKKWLQETLYKDINFFLGELSFLKGRRLIDVGCGTGQLIAGMRRLKWDVAGIEPFEDKNVMHAQGVSNIYTQTLEEFIAAHPDLLGTYDVVTLMSVLEHLLDPIAELEKIRKLVRKDTGVVCVRVPNDFNPLQYHAQKKNRKAPWWVAAPDHLNYFDTVSLPRILSRIGFEPLLVTTDFPMELFLLMGDDYVGDQRVGRECHRRRVNFELSVPGELRRGLYRSWAQMGLGRDVMVLARRVR